MSRVHDTLERLAWLQARRAYYQAHPVPRGVQSPVAYTTDPAWLVTMAINRRAGWPDDPSLARGSCMPVNGRYPSRAIRDCGEYQESERLARKVNTPRLIVRARECPIRYRERLRARLTWFPEEE